MPVAAELTERLQELLEPRKIIGWLAAQHDPGDTAGFPDNPRDCVIHRYLRAKGQSNYWIGWDAIFTQNPNHIQMLADRIISFPAGHILNDFQQRMDRFCRTCEPTAWEENSEKVPITALDASVILAELIAEEAEANA